MSEEFRKILAKKYAWSQELDSLILDEREKVKRGEVELDQHGYKLAFSQAPLDEVLKCAAYARQQPEIWGVITGYISRYNSDPEAKITEYENLFLNRFLEWYILKNELPYTCVPFIEAKRVLLNIALKELPDDFDSPRIREFLLDRPTIKE